MNLWDRLVERRPDLGVLDLEKFIKIRIFAFISRGVRRLNFSNYLIPT